MQEVLKSGFSRRGMVKHQQVSVPATTPQVNVAPQRAHADEAGVAAMRVDAVESRAGGPARNPADALYFLPGLAGTAFFSATLWSRELPYELRKRLPLAVRLSPLPMMFSLMSVEGLVRE